MVAIKHKRDKTGKIILIHSLPDKKYNAEGNAICAWCEKETGGKKYCNWRCYNKCFDKLNSKYNQDKVKKWQKENPQRRSEIAYKAVRKFVETKREHFNQLMFNYYQKNKPKHNSRQSTAYHLAKGNLPIMFKCKVCGTNKRLEIHHEIYPLHKEEIIQAVKDGKIYFLCKKHHRNVIRNYISKKRKYVYSSL